jgi:hypothetical protein
LGGLAADAVSGSGETSMARLRGQGGVELAGDLPDSEMADIIVTARKQIDDIKQHGFFWKIADWLGFHEKPSNSAFDTSGLGVSMNLRRASTSVESFNNRYQVTTRAFGALQAGGGLVEGVVGSGVAVVGLGTSEFGIGIPVAAGGGLIIAHGADQISTGLRTVWNGRPNDTLTSQGLQAMGMSPTAANVTDAGLGIAFTAGGSSVINSGRATMILPEGLVYSLDAPVIHGNSLQSPKTAYLYELYSTDGTFLKNGITQNMDTRYSKAFMSDKFMERVAEGSRADMVTLERQRTIANPGPLNLEPWAVKAKANLIGSGQ